MPDVSRRAFLKASLATAGAVAAVTVPAERAKAAPGKELATLIDIRKCIGCEACVEACTESNESKYPEPTKPFPVMHPVKRVPVADWSDKRDVTDRLTPYNWLYIQTAEGAYKGEEFSLTIPRRCMHCQNAPCVNMCPFGAATTQDNGVTRFDDDLCFGGAKCKQVCPWSIPQRQTGVGLYQDVMPGYAGNGVMYKCDRCYQLLEQGEVPACIDICPENVQTIGPRDEIIAEAHRIADEIGGFIYGEHENGGTNTIYVSPVPFEELDKVIDTGVGQAKGKKAKMKLMKSGKPHFKSVGNSMDPVNRWLAAAAIAPLAGVMGAVGKWASLAKREQQADDNDNQAQGGEK